MIESKSCTRVDLTGGTLDCWPLNAFVGDCYTINISIDIFTHVILEPRQDDAIELDIQDLKFQKSFKNLNELKAASEKEVQLLQIVCGHFTPPHGFKLTTRSESPVGAGLGGSSSLTISILKAFNRWLGQDLSLHQMVELAHNLEARLLKTPTGTQDYIPAVEPGLHLIHYSDVGFQTTRLHVGKQVFDRHMRVVYTGRSHHSGINNWQVIKAAVEGDKAVMQALMDLKVLSHQMKEICEKQDWNAFYDVFERETVARLKLSSGFLSPEITKLKSLCEKIPKTTLKICGAGGGGCVMIWSENSEQVEDLCQKNGFQVLPAKAVL